MKRNKSAFTLVELMVVVLIIGLLIAILLPSLNEAMEAGRRAQCAANLKGYGTALGIYTNTYKEWPKIMEGVGSQDCMKAVWLFMTDAKLIAPGLLVCPSDRGAVAISGTPDPTGTPFPLLDAGGNQGGNANKRSFSYSFQMSNTSVAASDVKSENASRFAIAADRCPSPDLAATSSLTASATLTAARAWFKGLDTDVKKKVNSPNHGGSGQNVMYQDTHVRWESDPWVGIGDDNIYTKGNSSGRCAGDMPGTGTAYADWDSMLVNMAGGATLTIP